jgi:hypothetical protein
MPASETATSMTASCQIGYLLISEHHTDRLIETPLTLPKLQKQKQILPPDCSGSTCMPMRLGILHKIDPSDIEIFGKFLKKF